MAKKLLLFSILAFNLLLPTTGFGQCPTTVIVSADSGTTICAGTEVTFSTITSGGENHEYQWLENGASVGSNSNTYRTSSLSNGAKIKVVVTSSSEGSCTKTSNELTMTVNAVQTPTVGITASKSSICPGETVSFSASPTNQGSTPSYEWFVNGISVQQGSSSTLNNPSTLSQGENTVRVVLGSSLTCVTTNKVERTINYTVKPVATIAATTSTEIENCINTAITPIKYEVGGGVTGAIVSGLPSGVKGSFSAGIYTISGTPTSAGTFNFTLNTTGSCEQTSATGSIKVNPNATLSLTSGNNNQTVCAAGGASDASIAPIKYEIGETGTGATASGLPLGISGSYSNGTFTISGSTSVAGAHNFTVTATGTCSTSPALTGSITISENLAPSVSINSSEPDNEICEGTPVTFTATPINGGSSPAYQWQINGTNTESNGNMFTTSSLTDGQTVTVIMTSNATCRTENTAISNEISTTVNSNLVPSVTIEASDTDFCAGDEVTYTAIPVNGGGTPSYQWKEGSTVVGSGASFTSSTLTNGQSISVTLTSSETCVTTSTAVSDPVVLSVNENLVPSVTIDSNDGNNILCTGSSIAFTAIPTNGGTDPEYQWQINGIASGGVTTSNTFSSSNLNDGAIVTAILISSEECLAENNVVSNEIPVQVDNSISGETPVWDNSSPSHNPTAICPSVSGLIYKVKPITGATSYDWTLPSGWSITNGNGTNEITVTASVSANAGFVRVKGRTECGASQETSIAVTTGTAAHVGAGPDQTVCPGTTEISLTGEIGGVITQQKDWHWSANVNGGGFTDNGFSNGGKALDGTYTIPTSAQNGGTVTIRIQSVKPAGNCEIKTDEMTITIQSAASISDPANKNQTICINSEIEPISFAVGGAGQNATTTGLPPGISGTFADGVFTVSGTPTEAGTFNYKVTTTGNCTNPSRSGILTINQRPSFTEPEEVIVCAGAETSTISFGGSSVSGTTYQWTNDNSSIGLAISGTGNINTFTAVNNTHEPVTANIRVTPIANNCEGTTEEFRITVYPTATFTRPQNITVCNGENLEDIIFAGSTVQGSTYKWTNSNISVGLAADGTGNISSFTASNTTNEPIQSTITVIPVANECDGIQEEFTITVNPTPAFNAPDNLLVCNGQELSQVIFSGGTVDGSVYNWTNDNPSIGLAASGTGGLPAFTAVNSGNEPVNATITVIPAANECEGEPVNFQITVNPSSTISSIEDFLVCNGEDFSELALSSTVGGTSFSWTNSNPGIGLAESGTGNIPAFTVENNTEQAVTATITVIPTANECEGSPLTFDVTVNPSASIDAGPDQTICSNGVASMAATVGGGASEGIWASNGSGTFNNNSLIAEYTPSDADALNGSVILTYTSNDPEGPCGTTSDTLELFINEEVVITTQPENIGICSTEPSELTVIASGDNLTYEWKRTDGANIVNSNGIYSSTLSFSNTTSVNAGEYYVIVKGEETCTALESRGVTINVDENIVIEEPITEVPICGDGFSEVTMKFIAHANGAPLTFTWYKDNVEVDASLDSNVTITTGSPDENGKYEGTLHLANITTAYNGDYYVEVKGPEEFTCSTAVTNPFQLRLNEIPELPVIEDLVVCQNETPDKFTVTTGTNLKWYLNEEDQDFIANESGQPVAPVPPTDTPGEFYYWVTQKPEACESEKVRVKVLIKEKPGIPEVEENIFYCLDDTAEVLSAAGTTGATLNWYDSETGEALNSAPIPNTEVPGDTTYWVSQTPNDGFGCESDRAAITVSVRSLPEVTASVEEEVICLGSAALLSATGGISYIWYDGEEVIGNEASISHTPTVAGEYTFKVFITDTNGCENTAEVNVQVEENTVAGTLTGPSRVCINSASGTLNLADFTGKIQRWEKSTDNGVNWIEIANTAATIDFSNIQTSTIFRTFVKNGVCEEMASNEIEVTIDPLPVGGELAFGTVGRVFTICQNADGDYAEPLNLTGSTGEVIAWNYRSFDATTWSTLIVGGKPFTGTSLTADLIESLNFQKTTIFQVEVRSGVCSPDALSETAILSVIPSDITPAPVTVDPGVVCLGEEVTLNSESGYQTGTSMLDQGAFDNASITNHGWRIRRQNSTTDLGFNTDANNTEFDRWKRATPRAFTTAALTNPYTTSGIEFNSGATENKGFALVSGNYSSTMETAVFSMGSTDQAILTFDQAYNLTPGASIKVEISRDGGASYETLYFKGVLATATTGIRSGNFNSFGSGTVESTPENKIQVDLGRYLGQSNLRIRFNYTGVRSGDIWAVDNIDVPEGPGGVTIEWRDYTNPEMTEGVLIGTNYSEKYKPTKIGVNIFEVKTKLVYNSNGDACEVAENAERIEVFVFDKYETTATAIVGSCGDLDAQLNATVTNASGTIITSFPTPDGYIGEWKIEAAEDSNYTLIDSNPEDEFTAKNDPNAILSASGIGTFKVSFILVPTMKNADGVLYENNNCIPSSTAFDVVLKECTTLDFDGADDYVDLGTGYTGNYSIEAWIRPEVAGGTIISGPNFKITTPSSVTPGERWYHIAVSNGRLYIDGVDNGAAPSGKGGEKTLIGANWNSETGQAENFFSGWIEEVRIWNGVISQEQVQFLMNQRLQNSANIGVEIPMPSPGLVYSELAGYYQLIASDILAGGLTADLANNGVNGLLKNMETLQDNTAPLPYYSAAPGRWTNVSTWAEPDVWDIPNSTGVTGEPIEWNIVKASHNISSDAKNITVLGLLSETGELEIASPTGPLNEKNPGQMLRVTHYLHLDGSIDLIGESQLLQDPGSIVDAGSTGYLERDQQGTASSYNYNYWSSPVSTGTGNAPYSVGAVMLDGSNSAQPVAINFGADYAHADGGFSTPRKVSAYWLHKFHGTANAYSQWHHIGNTGTLKVGEGYSMKGTSGTAAILDPQNYTFKGIPNNGDVTLNISMDQGYLIGNPYASALDANKFINDNLKKGGNSVNVFNGSLYFWSHFAGATHYLAEYVGGYAIYNLSGGIRAIANDARINATGETGGQEPQQYIPVGQGFFITTALDQSTSTSTPNTIDGGAVQFKNSQRIYHRETDGASVFHKPENSGKKEKSTIDNRSKILLKFHSPIGYLRQLLVTADPQTSNGFDIGYDAPLIQNNAEDMFWYFNKAEFLIQGVAHFGKNQELPLGIRIKEEKPFTISIDTLHNIPDEMEIFLKDSIQNVYHNLRKGAYESTASEGEIINRFKLVFENPDAIVETPGEEEVPENLQVIYVNGSREVVIRNPEMIKIERIYLNNLLGQQLHVYYDIPVEKEIRLPVKRFSSGIYIVRLQTEKGIVTKKIILE